MIKSTSSLLLLELTYNDPTGIFVPPAVLSKLYNADSLLLYNGAEMSSHKLVVPLNFFTLNFAPRFGDVILTHKEPVGLGLASEDLNSGIDVWGCTTTVGM